ncbi:XRE family transcriptional regulator [Clostridium botulinum]|uniref:XRE family transcriptional regulator n=1 Tax=Clostridium botulinum TaxID=1491 RepID=A0A6M0SKV0_CLOBO|nr:XRE family transcriptional regulator [Clostridium botulinum]NFF80930.1 helix-turn-helix transcriptional regulator [Clostridium botulinum]
MNIGENIKKYRTEKEISQEKLATKLDVSSRTLQSYEAGRTAPTIEVIKKIAIALDVPFYKLIENDENLSKEDIEKIKNNPFNFMPPSDIKRVNQMLEDQSEKVVNLIKCVNYWHCDNKYDLEKIIVGDAGSDISNLLIDIVENRLKHYNNLYERNNKK